LKSNYKAGLKAFEAELNRELDQIMKGLPDTDLLIKEVEKELKSLDLESELQGLF